jgi:hypothetical protein
MIRTIVTPQNNNINLTIPVNYIGKKIEVLLYTSEEVTDESLELPPRSVAGFKGFLTDGEADKYNQYLQNIRHCNCYGTLSNCNDSQCG